MLYIANEVFFSGTAAEVTPIRSIDRITIGNGGRGPITEKIQRRFFEIVKGETEDRFGWLTFVTGVRETAPSALGADPPGTVAQNVQGRNRSRPCSGYPDQLIPALSFGLRRLVQSNLVAGARPPVTSPEITCRSSTRAGSIKGCTPTPPTPPVSFAPMQTFSTRFKFRFAARLGGSSCA